MLAAHLILASSLALSSYTNVAGQVIHAAPLALTNNLVTFQTKSSTRTFPIKIFPRAEQQRIKTALGLPLEDQKPPRKRSLKEDFELRRRILDAQSPKEQ